MPELVIRAELPRNFLCLAGVIRRNDIAQRIDEAIDRFSDATNSIAHLGQQVVLYHPQGRDPFGPDGEPFWLGRELMETFDAPPGLQLNWTPGGDAAVLVHEGPNEKMMETHLALHRAVAARGRKLIGPNWELYGSLENGHGQQGVEVCYLLES